MDKISKLKITLSNLEPIHDNPIGLIHPYWARKPMNIIEELIRQLSNPGDIVLDPFMGSGMTIFSAIRQNRSVVGTDLNPLSVFLVKSILELDHRQGIIERVERFLSQYEDIVLPWFKITENSYIERERFSVSGSFENGNFTLVRTEIVSKTKNGTRWSGRRVVNSFCGQVEQDINPKYLTHPINFEAIHLLNNSRIAIPRGAKLSHFYHRKNVAAINCALQLIENSKERSEFKDILRLLLSSSLPLLRLSDKKASSQWPYWRPKNMLTSRNPAMILRSRLNALRDLLEWINNNMPDYDLSNIPTVFNRQYNSIHTAVRQTAVQDLTSRVLKNRKCDLIVTDPPYSDHVPYLEYSTLWIHIMGLRMPSTAYDQEIVKTDCPDRIDHTKNYRKRLSEGFDTCCKLIKKNGYIVWFYQDYDLHNWNQIDKIGKKNGVFIEDVIPIPKQRRSMKTVTSPGRTLDGDLVCIFRKRDKRIVDLRRVKENQDFKDLSKALNIRSHDPLFFKYAALIKQAFKSNSIDALANRFDNVNNAINYLLGK